MNDNNNPLLGPSKDNPSIDENMLQNLFESLFPTNSIKSYQDIKDRVLEGYTYTIKGGAESGRDISAMTGSGGVLIFINECEKNSIPAFLVAENILVSTNKGQHPISKLNVEHINDTAEE